MKKTVVQFLLLLLFSSRVFSQTWTPPIAVDSGLNFRFAALADSSVGYMYGYRARGNSTHVSDFLRTTDGGQTWTVLTYHVAKFGTYAHFWSVVDRNTVFILYTELTSQPITWTTDMGETWHVPLGVHWPRDLRYATMFTNTLGIVDTVNDVMTLVDSAKKLGEARVGGDYYLTARTVDDITADWSDSLHIYYAPQHYKYRPNADAMQLPMVITSDGGRHWREVFVDTVSHNLHFQQVFALKSRPNAILVPRDSQIGFYYTSDFGTTWRANRSYPGLIKKVVLLSPREIWAIANYSMGADSLKQQYILHSLDTGATWRVDSMTSGYRAVELSFSDPGHGLATLVKTNLPTNPQWDTNVYVSKYTNPFADIKSKPDYTREPGIALSIWPNPADGALNIALPEGETAKVTALTDELGMTREVPFERSSSQLRIVPDHLSVGAFIITVTSESGKKYVSRFMRR